MTSSIEDLYQEALNRAFFIRHTQPGLLVLKGRDRLPFLHRMTTNAIEGLSHWSICPTILTTPLARTIDRLWVLTRSDDLLILTSPGRVKTVEAWFTRHIFFNDDVQVTQPAVEWSLWGVYGPKSAGQVQKYFSFASPSESERVVPFDGGVAIQWKAPVGWRLLLSPPLDKTARENWPEAEREPTFNTYDILRIEAGVPLFGAEFNEDSIPLEAGLRAAVNFEKGCYTGQEIIARMDSRGQLARRLVGLRLSGPSEPGDLLDSAGRIVGKMTSCAHSPQFGWIGLSILRSNTLKGDTPLTLAATRHPVEVVDLPFTSLT